MKRNDRGIARSDMIHMIMCMLSGVSEMKSQNVIVRRLRLRKSAVGFGLDGVDDIGKLDGVLNEEHRDVVADEVPVTLFGIDLDGKAANVARQDRKNPCCRRRSKNERMLRSSRPLSGKGRRASRPKAIWSARSSHARRIRAHAPRARECARDRNERSFRENEIFQKRRTAAPGLQRILVVRNRDALLRRKINVGAGGLLVNLSPFPDCGLVRACWIGRERQAFLRRASFDGTLLCGCHTRLQVGEGRTLRYTVAIVQCAQQRQWRFRSGPLSGISDRPLPMRSDRR